MNILAWVVFIGLMIKAGSVIISYFVSIGNDEAAKNLYRGMDLYAYKHQNFWNYTFLVGYKVMLCITQAYIAFLLTSLLTRVNISKPFNADVVKLLQKISCSILCVWVVAMVHNIHIAILEKMYGLVTTYISGEFIFLAGIVYVLAQMFKRGYQLQEEQNLTI
jgi:hypothetical protein